MPSDEWPPTGVLQESSFSPVATMSTRKRGRVRRWIFRTLGIDLAKNLFRVHGVDAHGRTVVERELRRRQLLPFVAQLRPCLVGRRRAVAHTTGPVRLPSADTLGQADESAL